MPVGGKTGLLEARVTITISQIYLYPIKSCGGLSVTETRLNERGIPFDRHWMLVDEEGLFITQRKEPRLALIRPRFQEERLLVSAPGMDDLEIPTVFSHGDEIPVIIWQEQLTAKAVGWGADQWFSDYLHHKVRLVAMAKGIRRKIDPQYAIGPNSTAFSDGFPLLLISQSSLDELNRRLERPVPMNRFRPNLVVAGTEPFAEDSWTKIQTGDVAMHIVKPCARCIITTTDQETGERNQEPLRTLAGFRKKDSKILFGQNAIHLNHGTIRVGDPVSLIE